MSGFDVYIGASKDVLLELLEAAVRDIRMTTPGGVSVSIYATPGEGVLTFSDEDTGQDEPGRVTIEVEAT